MGNRKVLAPFEERGPANPNAFLDFLAYGVPSGSQLTCQTLASCRQMNFFSDFHVLPIFRRPKPRRHRSLASCIHRPEDSCFTWLLRAGRPEHTFLPGMDPRGCHFFVPLQHSWCSHRSVELLYGAPCLVRMPAVAFPRRQRHTL